MRILKIQMAHLAVLIAFISARAIAAARSRHALALPAQLLIMLAALAP